MESRQAADRVTVERATMTQDDYGQPIEGWGAVGAFAASVEPINGQEYLAAAAAQSEAAAKIRMRFHPDIASTDRMTHNGTAYDIMSVINPEMRNEELVLMCKSGGCTIPKRTLGISRKALVS